MLPGTRSAGTLLVAAVAALGVAGSAAAQTPRGLTAPAYPGNTFALTHKGAIVAGTSVRVAMSGHAEWNRPTDAFTDPYDLYLFVQNPRVEAECAPWYGPQLQAGINVDISASASGSGWVMEGSLKVSPAPPASGTDWKGESVPFAVKPGLGNRVLLCAYQRNIIDDVASYQLSVPVEQPRCRPTRSTVRKGRQLALRCNVSGKASVRFSGPRKRTVSTRISTKNGRAKVSTKALRSGRYRVTVTTGGLQLERPFTVVVR